MTRVTDDEGVYKMIVKKGTGEIVAPGAICRVHYNGYIEYRGEPFDSTRLRNRQQQIRLGASKLRFESLTHWAAMCPSVRFFTCLIPDDFTRQCRGSSAT